MGRPLLVPWLNSDEYIHRIADSRLAALKSAYKSGGLDAIISIAQAAEIPSNVGTSTASSIGRRAALELALGHLESPDWNLRQLARGILSGLFSQSGWPVLEESLNKIKVANPTPEALADVYLAAPADWDTWQRIREEDQAVQSAYWRSVAWFNVRERNAEDVAFVVLQLVAAHRSPEAVHFLALKSAAIAPEVVIQVLEAFPADVADRSTGGGSPLVSDYDVARLFDTLDKSPDVSDEVIAKLEIPYVGTFEHDRPSLALHREVTKDPSAFAEVITWAFKRSDGQDEGSHDEEEKQHRARIAFDILLRLRGLAGLMDDGTVDAEALTTWVREAQRLCAKRGRGEIGANQIGQVLANAPAGADGTWPCEPVRDVLDTYKSKTMGNGLIIGKRNLRGVTSRGVLDGGEQERSLAAKYREDASKIAAKWPFTAQLLRRIADSFEWEGQEHDQDADWRDQFES